MDPDPTLPTSHRRRTTVFGALPALAGAGMVALVACGPTSEPLETNLDLPVVRRSLPLRLPKGAERARVEVLGHGRVAFDGREYEFTRSEDGALRIDPGYGPALEDVFEELQRLEEPGSEGRELRVRNAHLVPFVVVAEASVPWNEVELVLEYGFPTRNQNGGDLLLAVRDPADPHPAAIRIGPPMGFGTDCNFGIVPVRRHADWSPSRNRATDDPVLRVSRLEGFRSEDDAAPELPAPPHLVGDELIPWLREPIDEEADGELGMEDLEGATWGDVVELFDLCIESGFGYVGRVGTYPTVQRFEWVDAGGSL